MKYHKIINFDSGNARGLSVVLFVSGCTHYCDGCHNPETWNEFNGKEFDFKVKEQLIEYIKNPHINNLVFSGGDPMHPHNIRTVLNIAEEVRQSRPDLNIIVYTGYVFEELLKILEHSRYWKARLFKYIDIVIDGRFDKNKPTPKLDYRGSLNQRALSLHEDESYDDISKNYFKTGELNNGNKKCNFLYRWRRNNDK